MISSLRYIAESRKGKLLTYLNNNTDEMTLEKQHQVYGAITEVDNILEVLSNFRHAEIAKESKPDELFLFRPLHGKGIFTDMKEFIREMF